MHKSEDYSLDDLFKHLQTKEETRNRDKRGKFGLSVNHVPGRCSRYKGKNVNKIKS